MAFHWPVFLVTIITTWKIEAMARRNVSVSSSLEMAGHIRRRELSCSLWGTGLFHCQNWSGGVVDKVVVLDMSVVVDLQQKSRR